MIFWIPTVGETGMRGTLMSRCEEVRRDVNGDVIAGFVIEDSFDENDKSS
jgi:hypothetical protein